jgi:hypothetical protein
MSGKFILMNDIQFVPQDWGKGGALCSPSSTSAKHLTAVIGRLYPGKGHNFHKHPNRKK